jgi:hypothetical protein
VFLNLLLIGTTQLTLVFGSQLSSFTVLASPGSYHGVRCNQQIEIDSKNTASYEALIVLIASFE